MRLSATCVVFSALLLAACGSGAPGGSGPDLNLPDGSLTGDGNANAGRGGQGGSGGQGGNLSTGSGDAGASDSGATSDAGGDGDGDGDNPGDVQLDAGGSSSSGGRDSGTTDPNAVVCVDRDEAIAKLEGQSLGLPSCTDDVCTKAHCLTTVWVPEAQRDMLADCTPYDKCVPDTMIATMGNAALPPCRSVGNAEGRCVSKCVPLVRAQADMLPRDSCAEDELCAPCFDPITHENTGACDLECDTGPVEEPVFFDGCCGDLGVCVPGDLVPENQVALLGADSCTGQGELCAPADVASKTYVPQTCRVPGNLEGRCLPSCLPDLQARGEFLTQEDCPASYLCAPCYDPFTGEDTQACRLNGDVPVDSPVTFAGCCSDGGNPAANHGTCVPQGLVPSELQSMIDDNGGVCTSLGGEATMCAPTAVADGSYVPHTCTSWYGRSNTDTQTPNKPAPGRCLAECLPDIAALADQLTPDGSDGCDTPGERCAPCFDPRDGTSTNACTLSGDTEPTEVITFTNCCSMDHDGSGSTPNQPAGRCIPKTAAGARAVALPTLNCEDNGEPGKATAEPYVCAPNAAVADPSFRFTACKTSCGADIITCGLAALVGIANKDGVCLPSCMLSEYSTPIGGNAANLYGAGNCTQPGYDCAPCLDPSKNNAPTGACN